MDMIYIMNMYNCIKVIFDNFFYLELRLIIIINFIFYCLVFKWFGLKFNMVFFMIESLFF